MPQFIPVELGIEAIKYTDDEIKNDEILYCDNKPVGSMHVRPAFMRYQGINCCFKCLNERVFG